MKKDLSWKQRPDVTMKDETGLREKLQLNLEQIKSGAEADVRRFYSESETTSLSCDNSDNNKKKRTVSTASPGQYVILTVAQTLRWENYEKWNLIVY